jgi:NAD-dependent oxidoreductase involved in siderophore biosynthesis
MFLPLLNQSKRNAGKGMIGMIVSVYTSDDQRFVYAISAVLPRVPADSHFLDKAIAAKQETLWLQTSTGPGGSFPKLQVVARAVGVEGAAHDVANPRPRPVSC